MKHLLPLPRSRRLLAVSATLLLAMPLHAMPDAQFVPAFNQFIQASQGDDRAIEPAASTFAALLKTEPANPVLMAYAGASTSLKATATWLPWKKLSYAEDGMAQLDKALALLTPVHNTPQQRGVAPALEVRLVAANTFLAVPGFMNKGARGARLLNEVLASPLLATAPLEFRATVWLAGAKQAVKDKRLDEARRYLNEVIKANAPQADAARAQLKALAS